MVAFSSEYGSKLPRQRLVCVYNLLHSVPIYGHLESCGGYDLVGPDQQRLQPALMIISNFQRLS